MDSRTDAAHDRNVKPQPVRVVQGHEVPPASSEDCVRIVRRHYHLDAFDHEQAVNWVVIGVVRV